MNTGEISINDLKQYIGGDSIFVKDLNDVMCLCGKLLGAGRTECDECEKIIPEPFIDPFPKPISDIEIVMAQAECSEIEAIEALQAADGDLVTAIMNLTTE